MASAKFLVHKYRQILKEHGRLEHARIILGKNITEEKKKKQIERLLGNVGNMAGIHEKHKELIGNISAKQRQFYENVPESAFKTKSAGVSRSNFGAPKTNGSNLAKRRTSTSQPIQYMMPEIRRKPLQASTAPAPVHTLTAAPKVTAGSHLTSHPIETIYEGGGCNTKTGPRGGRFVETKEGKFYLHRRTGTRRARKR